MIKIKIFVMQVYLIKNLYSQNKLKILIIQKKDIMLNLGIIQIIFIIIITNRIHRIVTRLLIIELLIKESLIMFKESNIKLYIDN